MKGCKAREKTYLCDTEVTITNPSQCLLEGPDATNKVNPYQVGLLIYWGWKTMTRSPDEQDKKKRRHAYSSEFPELIPSRFGKETQ